MWRGQTDGIGRLIKGVDWEGVLSEHDVSDELEEALDSLEYVPLLPTRTSAATSRVRSGAAGLGASW
jgi:hypothetical protein